MTPSPEFNTWQMYYDLHIICNKRGLRPRRILFEIIPHAVRESLKPSIVIEIVRHTLQTGRPINPDQVMDCIAVHNPNDTTLRQAVYNVMCRFYHTHPHYFVYNPMEVLEYGN